MYRLWLVGCCLLSSLCAFQVQELDGDWRAVFIEQELAPIKELEGIKSMIAAYEPDEHTQRYKIEGNCLQDLPTDHLALGAQERHEIVCEIFETLLATKSLPDMEFWIHLGDAFIGRDTKVPVFAFSTLKEQRYVINMPDFEMFTLDQELFSPVLCYANCYPWKMKLPIAFWRGSTTSGDFRVPYWREFPRSKLVLQAAYTPDLVDAKFTNYCQGAENNQDFLDNMGPAANRVSISSHIPFKYLIDVDGNASSYSRYFWILLSNCMPLKVESNFIQWYYVGLTPYYHYLPVKEDSSNLSEQIEWAKGHDAQAEQIANNSQAFAKQYLSEEGVYTYLYHLFKRYAEVCNEQDN